MNIVLRILQLALTIAVCSVTGNASSASTDSVNATLSATAATLPPPTGVLPAWVSKLSPGQWFPIPNTAMSSVAPSPTPAGNTGPQSKVIAWTSFVVDTRTSKVYSVANGGHGDYSGNEVDELALERDQPVWRQILKPTPNTKLTNCTSYYSDDRPTSRHTYYGVTLDEFNDRIMLFGGAPWCSNGGFFTAISSYNIGTNRYSPSTAHGSLPKHFGGVAAYALNPLTGDVYASRNFKFGRWKSDSNTFTTLKPTGSAPYGDYAMSAMDTTRGQILIMGGEASSHLYTIATNSFTKVTLSGPNAVSVAGASFGAMFYVAAMDRYLVRLGHAGGNVYQVDPTTFTVTPFATIGGAAVPSTQNGPFNKFLYVPRLRGAIYVPSYAENAWFLRIH